MDEIESGRTKGYIGNCDVCMYEYECMMMGVACDEPRMLVSTQREAIREEGPGVINFEGEFDPSNNRGRSIQRKLEAGLVEEKNKCCLLHQSTVGSERGEAGHRLRPRNSRLRFPMAAFAVQSPTMSGLQ
jgi:hypothetical protein